MYPEVPLPAVNGKSFEMSTKMQNWPKTNSDKNMLQSPGVKDLISMNLFWEWRMWSKSTPVDVLSIPSEFRNKKEHGKLQKELVSILFLDWLRKLMKEWSLKWRLSGVKVFNQSWSSRWQSVKSSKGKMSEECKSSNLRVKDLLIKRRPSW